MTLLELFSGGDGLGAQAAGGAGPGEASRGEVEGLEEGDDEGGSGLVSDTGVAVDGGGVEVDRVAGEELVNDFAVLDAEGAAHDVEELVAGVLVVVVVGKFAGLKLGEVRVELAFGDEVAEAFEVIAGMLDAGLREAHAIGGAVNAKEGERDGAEEVVEVLAEDHGDASEVAQGGDDASGLELREEAGGEAGVATQLREAERGLLTQGADAQTDALFGDERFDSIAAYLDVGVIVREDGRIFVVGEKDYVVDGRRRYRSRLLCGVLLVSHCGSPRDTLFIDRCIESSRGCLSVSVVAELWTSGNV
jgi:hypothetical protein